MGMSEEEAKAYLERKGKKTTKENIDEIMQKGKIYGDPKVEVEF